ncbi:MAG: hypothetical protein K2J14_07315 [Treponemataceae bacterium]|nr:hypothetical protein [Treponemataceae bacterium]
MYKPVELGTEKPASGKYYFISTSWDNEGNSVSVNKYFHNAWVADKTPVTDDVATMRWSTDTSGATQTNMATYNFQFRDNSISNTVYTTIKKTGDKYVTDEGIAITLTAGTLDSTTFTIKELPNTDRYLPGEDEKDYYNQYNNDSQYYNNRYVSYGDITYTRGK